MLLIVITLLLAPIFPLMSARGQNQQGTIQVETSSARGQGRILRSYREDGERSAKDRSRKAHLGRPDWVEVARQRAVRHLQERKDLIGLEDAESELRLMDVIEDDLGQTHVRMDQMRNGVKVFGGQIIAHLEDDSMSDVSGWIFGDARIDTRPAISKAQAIRAARREISGDIVGEPQAKLVILPHRIIKDDEEPGATLVYQIELIVEDESEASGSHQFFVDAKDGSIVWRYNSSPNIDTTGRSIYSGTVPLRTSTNPNNTGPFKDLPGMPRYILGDGATQTYDMNNGFYETYAQGDLFTDYDNLWGDGRQAAAVDAHFGANQSRDYFFDVYQWKGIDGAKGNGVNVGVHYGNSYVNAKWNGLMLLFGDGGTIRNSTGSVVLAAGPLVSLDIVGHEYTHAITGNTARLIYSGESGAVNESFSDIFGAAIEFYVAEKYPNLRINPDYRQGEDVVTASADGNLFFRDMRSPGLKGDPNHYSLRINADPCTPTDANDQCGVHSNSGIMNNAFTLLAEGGVHPLSGIYVPPIGRRAAERIFFRALTSGLTEYSRFYNARVETLKAAANIFGSGSLQVQSTKLAWNAVGVLQQENFDFDRDRRTDVAVWRPSNGVWYISKSSDGGGIERQWGTNGDIIIPGDYNGDGRADQAVWRPSDGYWYLFLGYSRTASGEIVPDIISRQWGAFYDQPVPGDYDGDGKTDIAVWRPSEGNWYIIQSSKGGVTFQWGAYGDVPVPGDYDGDNQTDLAVWRPSNSEWYIVFSSNGAKSAQQWGTNGDQPVAGDYDKDGRTDIAVWRPSGGYWHILMSSTRDSLNLFGRSVVHQWGSFYDQPVPGDYDGDGRTELAVFRPSEGNWYVLMSSTINSVLPFGASVVYNYGQNGDVPVPKAYKYVSPATRAFHDVPR
jgi:Zn-dependent metalloprotease